MSRGSRVYQEQHITVEPGCWIKQPAVGGAGKLAALEARPGLQGVGMLSRPLAALQGQPAMVEQALPPPGRGAGLPPLSPPRARLPQSAEGDERFEPLTAVVTGQTSTGTARRSRRALAQASGATAGRRRLVQAPSARQSQDTPARQATMYGADGPAGTLSGPWAAAPAL